MTNEVWNNSLQFSPVAQSCPTLCDPMDCSTPGFPVFHCLLELAQTHVHWVSDAIQSSCPLLSPSLLPIVFPSIRIFCSESLLCIMWPKYWRFSFHISPIQGWFLLRSTGLISLLSKGLFSTIVWNHQFFSAQPYCPALTSVHVY